MYFELDPDSWKEIQEKYAAQIRATGPEFWERRARAEFASLMTVNDVRTLSPLPCEKRDRRGWVVMHERTS